MVAEACSVFHLYLCRNGTSNKLHIFSIVTGVFMHTELISPQRGNPSVLVRDRCESAVLNAGDLNILGIKIIIGYKYFVGIGPVYGDGGQHNKRK